MFKNVVISPDHYKFKKLVPSRIYFNTKRQENIKLSGGLLETYLKLGVCVDGWLGLPHTLVELPGEDLLKDVLGGFEVRVAGEEDVLKHAVRQ